MLCESRYISDFFVTSSDQFSLRAVNMAFRTAFDAQSSAFSFTRLIYVHCVSKEDFRVSIKGFSCVVLVCKEIHWSYVENLSERRVCLVPNQLDDRSLDDLFEGVTSPTLIRINCSCDITHVNPDDCTQESKAALIWDFEILNTARAAVSLPASEPTKVSAVDEFCHPVYLGRSSCNCTNFAPRSKCFVRLTADPVQVDLNLNLEALSTNDESGDSSADEEPVELFAESFYVQGSYHEERYQKALLKCSDAIRRKEDVSVRVKFEPDNVEDKNAIKFEVDFEDEWLIIGYCGVKKIPKLHKAMEKKELRTLTLKFVKREWIPWKASLCFYACVSVVKRGLWNKDEPNNEYNSNLKIS